MQKILKVNYKLLIADKMLGLRWNELINEFGSNGMTNIIIIADSKGKIVKVFDPSKNDYRKIFEFINKIGDQTYAN